MSIAFLVLADMAELLLPRLLEVLLIPCLALVVRLLLARARVVRFPLLVVLPRLMVEEEDFRGISRLAQHNI